MVGLECFTIGRFTFEPSWCWSEYIKSVVGPDSFQVSHVGSVVSEQIRMRMNDGTEQTIGPGQAFTIPPGHDVWVEGNKPYVAIEVESAEQYAKPPT